MHAVVAFDIVSGLHGVTSTTRYSQGQQGLPELLTHLTHSSHVIWINWVKERVKWCRSPLGHSLGQILKTDTTTQTKQGKRVKQYSTNQRPGHVSSCTALKPISGIMYQTYIPVGHWRPIGLSRVLASGYWKGGKPCFNWVGAHLFLHINRRSWKFPFSIAMYWM